MPNRLTLPVRLLLLAALLITLFATPAQAALAQSGDDDVVEILFFWGDGCPHCAAAEPFLEGLVEKYDRVRLVDYEVWYSEVNQAIWRETTDALGYEPRGVPNIIIGERYWEGFTETMEPEIEAALVAALDKLPPPPPVDPDVINLPIIGAVDLSHQSAFISTLLISFVDGFNPCSLWVLTMLLALTLHTGSRKKVILIGLIFIGVTGLVYALFIAGLFTVLSYISYLGWIQGVVAVVALFFAIVNIKDYFFYKEGLSFTISDKEKPGIARRMRSLMDASQTTWGLITGTVLLAAGVSLVEFSCTAGFPVLWTNILTAQGVAAGTFVALLVLYMIIYQLDEFAIFFTAVFTLKASRLEEKQGRILKLVGGALMLVLALVMIFNPALLNKLSSSLIIFAAAFVVVGLILLVHRVILPKFGIWIGTEQPRKKKKGKLVKAAKRH